MVAPLRRLSGGRQHGALLFNVIRCSGARRHTKTAAAKRAAGHKAAVSHFGQVKLQLANPETAKKVKLSESQGRIDNTGIGVLRPLVIFLACHIVQGYGLNSCSSAV